MKSNRYADFSPSRRLWNQFFTGAVWVAALFVILLVVGIIGMVLVRGLPHVNWTFLTTTSSILRGTNGILPAIINTLYIILLTLVIVLPLGVGAAVYLTEYATNRKLRFPELDWVRTRSRGSGCGCFPTGFVTRAPAPPPGSG